MDELALFVDSDLFVALIFWGALMGASGSFNGMSSHTLFRNAIWGAIVMVLATVLISEQTDISNLSVYAWASVFAFLAPLIIRAARKRFQKEVSENG